MLSFEVILQVFEDILRQNPFCEVLSNSHGYTLLAWEPDLNLNLTISDLQNRVAAAFLAAFPKHNPVFPGDWGSASTSRNQAFPGRWKCRFFAFVYTNALLAVNV